MLTHRLNQIVASTLVTLSIVYVSFHAAALANTTGPQQISSTKVFVLNNRGNSITSYALFRAGDVAPVRMIVGPNTKLTSPRAFTVDRAGRLFVVNGRGNEILIFNSTDNGDVAPRSIIRGSLTSLSQAISTTIDAAGKLLVLGADGSIEIFDPASTGNASPTAIVRDFLPAGARATSLGADAMGRLFVSDAVNSSVYVYAETQTGVSPMENTISGSATQISSPVGIAVDSIGRIYLSQKDESVLLIPNIDRGDLVPTVALRGSNTKIFGAGVSGFDAGACIYTPNFRTNTVTVFDPGTTGNAAPSAIYQGSRTRLDGPVSALLY